jgi:response regulator RpfG family c-di-GMP phosphodiesterase
MASVAETRDPETGAHILRTQHYVRAIAEYMYEKDIYAGQLDESSIAAMYMSAPLHDVGKVGIPDEILLKPGRLTEEEFEIMKTHAVLGVEIIKRAEEESGDSIYLKYGRMISETHHEKWNGSGYPKGLAGEEIPLCGRLMAVADVYDALISERHYKKALPHEDALAILQRDKGTHFDPLIIEAFMEIESEIEEIAKRHRD